jgi:hypothetical protein
MSDIKTFNILHEFVDSITKNITSNVNEELEVVFKTTKAFIAINQAKELNIPFNLVIKVSDNEFLVYENCKVTKTILRTIFFTTTHMHRFDVAEYRKYKIRNLGI